MSIYIKDVETDKAVRKLAKLRNSTVTEAVRSAVIKELEAEKNLEFDEAAVATILAKIDSWPKTGLKADKDFFDSLYED